MPAHPLYFKAVHFKAVQRKGVHFKAAAAGGR
jgi:hypothetical protein